MYLSLTNILYWILATLDLHSFRETSDIAVWVYILLTQICLPLGGDPSPHAQQGRGQGSPLRSLVLQEGTWLLQSPTEKDEKFAKKDQAWKVGCVWRWSFWALCGLDNNQVRPNHCPEAKNVVFLVRSSEKLPGYCFLMVPHSNLAAIPKIFSQQTAVVAERSNVWRNSCQVLYGMR